MSYADAYDPDEGIAIVGLAGRFPGARDVEEFWENLVAGRETIAHFADDELEPASPVDMEARRQPDYVRARGILEDVELFDADFFGITPREAEVIGSAAARVPGDGLGGARARGLRPGTLRRARSACSPGMSNNTYFLQNLSRPDVTDIARQADDDAGQREGLPRDARLVQARSPRPGAQRPHRVLDVARRGRARRCRACSTTSATWRSPAASRSRCRSGAATCTRRASSPRPTAIAARSTSGAAGTVFSNGVGDRRAQAARATRSTDGDTIYAVINGVGVNNDGAAEGQLHRAERRRPGRRDRDGAGARRHRSATRSPTSRRTAPPRRSAIRSRSRVSPRRSAPAARPDAASARSAR